MIPQKPSRVPWYVAGVAFIAVIRDAILGPSLPTPVVPAPPLTSQVQPSPTASPEPSSAPDQSAVTTYDFGDPENSNNAHWTQSNVDAEGFNVILPGADGYGEMSWAGPGTPDYLIGDVPYVATFSGDLGGNAPGERQFGLLQNAHNGDSDLTALEKYGMALIVNRNGILYAEIYRSDTEPRFSHLLGLAPSRGTVSTVTISAVAGMTTFTDGSRTVSATGNVALSGSPRPSAVVKGGQVGGRLKSGTIDITEFDRFTFPVIWDGSRLISDGVFRTEVPGETGIHSVHVLGAPSNSSRHVGQALEGL